MILCGVKNYRNALIAERNGLVLLFEPVNGIQAPGAGSPCEFNDLRNSDGACLIRRIAQINNADEQIEWLKKWQKENPPKPHWIREKDGIDNIRSCSECGKRVYVTADSDLPNYLKNYCPNCGTQLEGEIKCD